MASDERVARVDERGRPQSAEHETERAGQPQLGQERHASSPVAADGRAVAVDEPPALVSFLLGNRAEQYAGLLVVEGKQAELVAAVDGGDDPRRPAAEPSTAGIEEHRAREGF